MGKQSLRILEVWWSENWPQQITFYESLGYYRRINLQKILNEICEIKCGRTTKTDVNPFTLFLP